MPQRKFPICVQPENDGIEPRPGWSSDDELLGNAALVDRLPAGSAAFDHPIPHEDLAAGHNVRYNLVSSPDGLGVHVPIYAHPSDVGHDDFERMAAGIDATWNERFDVCRNGDNAATGIVPQ